MATYNMQKESLLRQHISALESLDTIYTMKVFNFVKSMDGMNGNQIGDHIFNVFPQVARPFQLSAGQIAMAFYTKRRDQATENTSARVSPLRTTLLDLDIDKFIKGSLTKTGVLTEISRNAAEAGDITQAAGEFQKISTSVITDIDHDVILDLSAEDPFSTKKLVRAASPDGCNFCKTAASGLSTDDEVDKFHANCHCVLDAGFEGEVDFRQAFMGTYEHDIEEAKKLIDSGEAGSRTLQVGTADWTADVNQKLTSGARKYRKDVAANEGIRGQEATDLRAETTDEVNFLTEKAKDVAKGKANWTAREIDTLDNWGFPNNEKELGELTKPTVKKIDSFTTKNLATAVDIVQGKREVKETP